MYTVLIYQGGREVEAVLLSATEDCLRFAVNGRNDVTELRNVAGRWVTESGAPVELGAMIALDSGRAQRPRTLTAGAQAS